jgi:predicted metalloprotease
VRYGEGDRESDNVEDRRGAGGGRGPFGGGGGRGIRIPMGGGGLSFGTLIFIGIICLALGINPLTLLTGGGIEIPNMPSPDRRVGPSIDGLPGGRGVERRKDEMSTFVRRVLADTEDVWEGFFKKGGLTYRKPSLVIFEHATQTACGVGQTAMGPFYCPIDQKVYIDLEFYDLMKQKFGAPGDFAQAYVIAHEVGHHVQTLLGIAENVQRRKQGARSQEEANTIQVKMELQADCFAGVWASVNDQIKGRLQPGDIEEGLNAAAAIGDDTLQRKAGQRVSPESFTHGSASQRMLWFKRGMDTGNPQSCDTFTARDLG